MQRQHLTENLCLKDIDIPVGTFHYVGNLKEVKPKGKPKFDLLKEINQDPDKLTNEMVMVKKRKMAELLPTKRAKQAAWSIKQSSNDVKAEISVDASADISVSSTVTDSDLAPKRDDDDIEWSDCDELELSRNISLLEQSMNQSSSKLETEFPE